MACKCFQYVGKTEILSLGKELNLTHWRSHQTSPTVVSLKGRLPKKLQSKSTFLQNCSDTQSVSSWFYKETEIQI